MPFFVDAAGPRDVVPGISAPLVPASLPPAITSIGFDQNVYTPGQLITVTVTYTAGVSPSTQTLSGTATDSVTGQVGQLSVTFTVMTGNTTTVAVADSGGRTWAKQSDNGSVAVFTSVA